jgi:hypothetical protein
MKKRVALTTMLAAALILTAGCGKQAHTPIPKGQTTQTPGQGSGKIDVPPKDQLQVVIYRGNADATEVVKETVTIANMESNTKKALVLFNELKKTPSDSTLNTAVPENVQLLGAEFSGDTLTLDFNEGVQQLQGAATEKMFLDAVTRTMFENFPTLQRIQFKINGHPAEVLTQMSVGTGVMRPNDMTAGQTDDSQSLALAVSVVERYFFLTSNGDYNSAWNLIHPSVQKVGELQHINPKEMYLASHKQASAKLAAISGAKLLDEYKPISTMLMQINVAVITCKLSDGTEMQVHLSKDDQGNWRLYWNPETKKLE